MLELLSDPKVSVESITSKVLKDPDWIPDLILALNDQNAKVRFRSAKVMRQLSDSEAGCFALYPYWDHFVGRSTWDNTFLRSDAMHVIANLTAVDKENRFEQVFDKYFSHLNDESMIPAANLAGNCGKIAVAKPDLQTKIIKKLINIDDTSHSQECKNIIKGKVIDSFGEFFEQAGPADQKKILEFVKGELKNARNSTRKKAEKFLRTWDR